MKLITNGDDFGITKAVNYAMIECYKSGIMKSCSMMINMPGVSHAVSLMNENPGLSVGIHLNLTVGKPLLATHKTLIKEDGTFNKGNLKDSSSVDPAELRAELMAQMDYYIEMVGKKPDHINSHHGVEQIKGAEAIVCELSRMYDLPVRRFFTLPVGNHKNIAYEIPLMKLPADMAAISTPQTLISMYTDEELASNNIYEFALHPGYADYDIEQISSLTIGRAHDANVFLCDEVKEWVTKHNVELVDYRVLPKYQ